MPVKDFGLAELDHAVITLRGVTHRAQKLAQLGPGGADGEFHPAAEDRQGEKEVVEELLNKGKFTVTVHEIQLQSQRNRR